MKEKERLIIVKQIVSDIAQQQSLPQKEANLQDLEQNEFVRRYLELKKEIEKIWEFKERFSTQDDLVKLRFGWALIDSSYYTEYNFSPCKHPVWIYQGSYEHWADPRCEHDSIVSCEDENAQLFHHNSYMCLECQGTIDTKDWRTFEKGHFVF